ncbi:MAG: tetratricopeptide repeat protein [Planctomycetota bacterium]
MEILKIESRCYCGFLINLDPHLVGRKGKCPSCNSVLVLPRLRAQMTKSEYVKWKVEQFPVQESPEELSLSQIHQLLDTKSNESDLKILDPGDAERWMQEHPSSLRDPFHSSDEHPTLPEEDAKELEVLDPKEAERWIQMYPGSLKDESIEKIVSVPNKEKQEFATPLKDSSKKNSKSKVGKKGTSWEFSLVEGVKAFKNQSYLDAIECFTKVIEENDQVVKAYLNRGLSHYELEQYDSAISDYQKVLEIEPGNEKSAKKLFRIFLSQKKMKNARLILEQYLKPVLDECGYYEKAMEVLDESSSDALNLMNQAIRKFPEKAEFLARRGYYYFKSNALEKALEDFLMSSKLDPTQASFFFNAGGLLVEMERYEEAIDLFSSVIELNPQDIQAYYNRGFCYQELGLKKLATKDFDTQKKLESEQG